MRFWLVHSGEVPLQDQIVAQVSLGILSGELAPGERLPSIRELARRFHLHSNTVSLAYRRLEREQWLEARRGSGMYVRSQTQGAGAAAQANAADRLNPLVAALVRAARSQGISDADLRMRLESALGQKVTAFLLVEPDIDLQRIVLAELAPAVALPVTGYRYPGQPLPGIPANTAVLVLPSKAAALAAALPAGTMLRTLKIRSVPQSLAPWLPAPTDALIGIASQWPPFLDFARTMLIAAGFHADSLLVRNPAEPGWSLGLAQTAAVVCDSHTATLLPRSVKAIPFRILADDTLTELQQLQTD